MRVLVTGGTGYIGAVLAIEAEIRRGLEKLLEEGES